jgi:hypothetical protein
MKRREELRMEEPMEEPKNPVYYTGVGSRETPLEVCRLFTRIAQRLEKRGYILRSGHAIGADRAFESGQSTGDIYLPWPEYGVRSYKNDPGMEVRENAIVSPREKVFQDYEELVAFGLRTASCPESHKLLHGRNFRQVVGQEGEPLSSFLVCWTKDGAETLKECSASTGGTGTAIKLASLKGVPVVNFQRKDAMERLAKLVKGE